jgi:hypothetical protein
VRLIAGFGEVHGQKIQLFLSFFAVITKSAMQPQQKMSPFAKFRQLDRQNSLPK